MSAPLYLYIMSYLLKADLQNSIEQTLLDALDWSSDDSIITTACSQAIGQLKAYTVDKYDIVTELAKTSVQRDEMVLMIAKDLAIYHIWSYVDAASIPNTRRDRYKAAIDFLKDIQSGAVTMNLGDSVVAYIPIAGGSNDKRVSHY